MSFRSLLKFALPPVVLVTLAACGADGKKVDSPSSSGGAAGGGSATGGSSSGGMTGTACAPAPDLGVRFVGRTDGCDPSGVRYAWSGSGFVGWFRGTGLKVKLKERGNQHTVLIDDRPLEKFAPPIAENWYTLVEGLEPGEHSVQMYRRTEASFGATVVEAFEVIDGEMLAPPPPFERRIEVIGDSITCGYGNEGTSTSCSFSADTENHYQTYGAILARSLEAELSTVAWSGKGVIHNYGGDKNSPMPVLYDRVDPNDRLHPWDFSYQPDLVVINLGTNDYSTAGNEPTDEAFQGQYKTFLAHLRDVYPKAFMLLTIGPLLSGNALATARRNIRAAVDARIVAGDNNIGTHDLTTPNTAPGCDWHPSIPTHEAIAKELQLAIRGAIGW